MTSSKQLFSKNLVKYIISRTTGTHIEDELFDDARPSRKFILGTLAAPRKKDRLSHDNDGDSASIRAQRLKVSFLADKTKINEFSEIYLKITGNVFYQINEKIIQDQPKGKTDGIDQKTNTYKDIQRWKRVEFSETWNVKLFNNIPIKSQQKNIDFSAVRLLANNDPLLRDSKKIYEDIWKAEISVNVSDFDEKDLMVTIYLKNAAVEPDKPDSFERTLFNCKLTGSLNDNFSDEFSDEYQYEGHKQRFFYSFRPINCQALWDIRGKAFSTDHFGYFEQDNIRPRASLPGMNLTFNNLMRSESAIEGLENLLKKMNDHHLHYLKNIPAGIDKSDFQPRDGDKQKTWGEREELIQQNANLISRFSRGIDLIKTDSNVKESFLKTNEAFENYYSTKGITNANWRIFQLVFLISSLESVVKETELDVVDVLHVDTGGGKSEAYFALVVFTAFFERTQGKAEGVTAIVKFPLRMLSIQQLERLSSILIHADQVRKKNKALFPGQNFSLGYYVGNTEEFPDLYKKVKDTLYYKKILKNPAPESIIISRCPLCTTQPVGTVRLVDDEKHGRIVHKCDKCGEEFHIYFSDREVFRWRPTVIVSTVDKWAALSSQRRIRSLLGGSGSHCPEGHGFIPSGEICEEKKDESFQCKNIGKNERGSTGPRLSIQDEMHLLKEGFGTISAHFEGLIESINDSSSHRPFKHVAMSATLNGTKKQIDELYKKETFLIPGRCPDGVGSPTDIFFERIDGPKRIIYGFKPNLRDNHYAALRTLLHYLEFIIDTQMQLNSNPTRFCEIYSVSEIKSGQELINHFLIPLTYHIKKQDVYDMDRLKDAVIGDILERKYKVGIAGKTLTGDTNLEDLKKAIDDVRNYIKAYDPQKIASGGQIFEPLYATSVVSHGVDLEELNLMVFQGLPYTTSEYIQALSRVGRKDLGVVLLWFYPNRVRDDSFYRNFKRYHETLDHQVKPIPVNRYSRLGLHQTINSIFCATVINHMSNLKGKPLYRKQDVAILDLNDKKHIVEFIKKVYRKDILDINVHQEVEDRINEILQSNEKSTTYFPKILAKSGDYFYRNQSGMRGIQKQLIIGMINEDKNRILKRGK
jgi:hypothetical protein